MKINTPKTELSNRARALWGKSPNRFSGDRWPEGAWLPLHVHLSDSAAVMECLWDEWLPNGTKIIICSDLSFGRKLAVFSAAAHDIGKAMPGFAQKSELLSGRVIDSGLPIPNLDNLNNIPHGLAGHCILKRHGFDDSIAVVVGGHHGIPPTEKMLNDILIRSSYEEHTGFKNEAWVDVQDEMLRYAASLAGLEIDDIANMRIARPVQAILTGLVIMADWIASDESRFEYISPENFRIASSKQRTEAAWQDLNLPPYWIVEDLMLNPNELFRKRFDIISPRPVQEQAIQALLKTEAPGIVVIEAPMGEGKTEAALAAAEILAKKTGRGGVFVGLPTMATSDGMFGRVKKWIESIGDEEGVNYSIYLAHGKSNLNDDYAGIKTTPNVGDDGGDNVVVNDWLRGRKKGVLADFVVGTIDQLLFTALKMKHLALRHLAFANKVVIIDECHAYDAYMNQYLLRALEWLGQYHTPVIILSATLPNDTRKRMIDAYLGTDSTPKPIEPPVCRRPADYKPPEAPPIPKWVKASDYPLITYSDHAVVKQISPGSSNRHTEITFEYLPDEKLPDKLAELLSDGGCVGIIRDTVSRAQETAALLQTRFDIEVKLIHSRFLSVDRVKKEKELREKLGPGSRLEDGSRPQSLIVVGTQVLEQSLDIDFDLLITDIAPMDLVIQRVGRLYRHERSARPAKLSTAKCFITGVEDVAECKFTKLIEKIYNRYLLLNTLLLLPVAPDSVKLPDSISPLVQAAYAEGGVAVPNDKTAMYSEAKAEYTQMIEKKEKKARNFRISSPNIGSSESLIEWLDLTKGDKDERKAEASVRDTSDSIEVIVVQKKQDGCLYLLPWIGDDEIGFGTEITTNSVPENSIAKIAAACTVSLPMSLCAPRLIDKVIRELEERAINAGAGIWEESYWLEGMLLLILDEKLKAEMFDYSIGYDDIMGLVVTRKEV
jgi:CRISPR-associated endonuclease/helicase Cas3